LVNNFVNCFVFSAHRDQPARVALKRPHTRAAKKHAKILLFSELGKFYCKKVRF
jgi:hypothetical protein